MNRYQLCNEQAEIEKQRKREAVRFTRHKWESIWTYLDEEDVYYSDGTMRPLHQIRRRAYYALQSYVYSGEPVEISGERIAVNGAYSRNTEFEAIWNLFEAMLAKEEWRKLTNTQRETVALQDMANQANIRQSTFISNVLSITVNAANRRLRTISEKNAHLAPEFSTIQIKSALETTPRFCPFCKEQSRLTRISNPVNVMCWKHHERFVLKQDFGFYPRPEYERVIMDSTRDYWLEVRQTIEQKKIA